MKILSAATMLALTSQSLALPYIAGPDAIEMVNKTATSNSGIAFSGHPHDDTGCKIYVPYTKLEVTKKNGRPILTVAYSRKGALVTAELKPGYDKTGVEDAIRKIKNDLTSWSPSHGGRSCNEDEISIEFLDNFLGSNYRLIVNRAFGNVKRKVVIASSDATHKKNENLAESKSVSFTMGRQAADILMEELINQGTKSIGFELTYNIPARTHEYKSRIQFNWEQVYNTYKSLKLKDMFNLDLEPYQFMSEPGLIDRGIVYNLKKKYIKYKQLRDEVDEKYIIRDIRKIITSSSRLFIANASGENRTSKEQVKLAPIDFNWITNYYFGKHDFSGGSYILGNSSTYSLKRVVKGIGKGDNEEIWHRNNK